jgi:hypothetical protein
MNILMIVLSLICAYIIFVSASYFLARLLFPKIEVDMEKGMPEKPKVVREKRARRLTSRVMR